MLSSHMTAFLPFFASFFFFNDTATTEIYTLSLHDALPILERGLEVVVVEAHAEGLQVAVLLGAQLGDREAPDRGEVLAVVGARPEPFRGDLADVLAVVAVGRELGRETEALAHARLHREREVVDLVAGVVVVELARDLKAARFEQRRDRVAERGLPPVPDVQGAGRVRRHELDHDALAARALGAPVASALGEDGAHDVLLRLRAQAQVDEPGTR